jgi:hypothetical protein
MQLIKNNKNTNATLCQVENLACAHYVEIRPLGEVIVDLNMS